MSWASGSTLVLSSVCRLRVCLIFLSIVLTPLDKFLLIAYHSKRYIVFKDSQLGQSFFWRHAQPVSYFVPGHNAPDVHISSYIGQLFYVVGIQAPGIEFKIQVRTPKQLPGQLLFYALSKRQDSGVNEIVILIFAVTSNTQEECRHSKYARYGLFVNLHRLVYCYVFKRKRLHLFHF